MMTHESIRIEAMLREYAREPVQLQKIKATIYAYGSELACLRILNAYRHSIALEKVRVGYSKNLQTWFFALDT